MTCSRSARSSFFLHAALAGLFVLAGCRANDAAPQAAFAGAQKDVISDAVHNDGTPGFYFLPPMVPPHRGLFGPFRPDVRPTVWIDQVKLSPPGCTSDCDAAVVRANVARWTRTSGSDWRRIRAYQFGGWRWGSWCDDDDWTDGDDDVPEGYFVVRWDSDDFGVKLYGIYRLHVSVPSNGDQLELGYADIEIVANAKQFRKVDTSEYTPLIDGRTLKIKFRIDSPALACVDVSCPPGGDGSPGVCDPQSGQCTTTIPPIGTPCTDDGNPCTIDVTDAAGACVHPAGNAGKQCHAAAGDCDLPASCDGVSDQCPATFKPAGTLCREAAGVCDVAETCTGTSPSCPADAFAPPTVVCRDAAAACDVAENCTGTSASCPADAFAPPTVVCRDAAGACDVAENCTGTSASCPADFKVAAGTVCRASAGPCDVAESCDGSTDACPADAFAPPTVVCRDAAGACDVAEACTGTSASCPADLKVAAGTVCRASAGPCDVAESCDGSTDACPVDAFAPPTVVCRDAAGVCDAPETCTGTSASCPADLKLAAETVCRASIGQCDDAESCDGSGNDCPLDSGKPDETPCDGSACGPDAFVCRANACVPQAAHCAPGFNDDGTGTCVQSGPLVCAPGDFDGFDGDKLDPHWRNAVGTFDPATGETPLGLPAAPRNDYDVAGSYLLLHDAKTAPVSSGSGSWIFNANTDLGNQMAWSQSIGVNDFDVRFSFAWSSTVEQATLAGIGLTGRESSDEPDKVNYLEVRAGFSAPGNQLGFPIAILRGLEDGYIGQEAESGSGEMRLRRSGGLLTIEFNNDLPTGSGSFCAPLLADIRNVAIFSVHGVLGGMDWPFGEFDLGSVQICKRKLNCAPGYGDLGNGACEPVPPPQQ